MKLKRNCKECGKSLHAAQRGRKITGLCLHCFNKIPRSKRTSFTDGRGYVFVLMPEHPRANHVGYVKRAVLVLEQNLGRELLSSEVPHHINHDKGDDRPENLDALTKSEHGKLHRLEDKRIPPGTPPNGVKIGDPNYRFFNGDGQVLHACPDCGIERWIDCGAVH